MLLTSRMTRFGVELVALAWFANGAAVAQNGSLPLATPTAYAWLGVPAIPRPSGTTNPLTESVVRAFVLSQQFPGTLTPPGSFAISRIEIVEGSNIQSSNDRLARIFETRRVAYVEVTGRFVFRAPPGTKPPTYSRAFEVFDGVTGNILMVGALK